MDLVLVVVLTVLFWGVAARKLVILTMLTTGGEQTIGRVDDVHGRNSRRRSAEITYSFKVLGKPYEGTWRDSGSDVPDIGAEAPVTYLPSDPSVSFHGLKNDLYVREFPLGWIFTGLFFALMTGIKLWSLRVRASTAPAQQ